MDKFLNKKYKFSQWDENFNEYLCGIGLNLIHRKLAQTISTSTQLVKLSSKEYSLNTIVPFKIHQQKFILGEEKENLTMDGRKVRNTFTIEGNKLIEKQVEPTREVTLIKEFQDKQMLGTAVVKKKDVEKEIIAKFVSVLIE